jgi:hypothetical protein
VNGRAKVTILLVVRVVIALRFPWIAQVALLVVLPRIPMPIGDLLKFIISKREFTIDQLEHYIQGEIAA